MRIRYRLIVACLLMVAVCCCGPKKLRGIHIGDSEPMSHETTIRNVTDQTVQYHLAVGSGDAQDKSLIPDQIERIPIASGEDIIVSFDHGDETKRYSLEPGMPYSFRYDNVQRINLYPGSHGRADAADLAPYVPTSMRVVEKMLDVAEVSESDVIYDIGCGDGRIVISAAKLRGARGVGIDIDPRLIKLARDNAAKEGVADRVEFREQDATKADFSDATIVMLYLLSESNETLRPHLERQLKPGTPVVAHDYPIFNWRGKVVKIVRVDDDGKIHNLYLYHR